MTTSKGKSRGIRNDAKSRYLTSVTVLLLERLDESDVLLLGVRGRDTLVNELLPCVSLGLALFVEGCISVLFGL